MAESADTPTTTSTEIIDRPSIFAHLVPGNYAAKAAFSLVIDRLVGEEDWIPYARRYLYYEPRLDGTQSPSVSSEAEVSDAVEEERTIRWHGWYILDFGQLPSNPHRGWRLGSGRLRTGQEDVEFLLTTRPRIDRVNAQHCRLNFNFDSFVLLITAELKRQVSVLGNGTQVLRGTSMAVPSRSTSIELGNLRFELKFTDMPKEVYRAYIRETKEFFGTDAAEPPMSLDPTPADSDYHITGYVVKEPLALGGSCVVCSGIDLTTGALVAIKRITKHAGNVVGLDHEISVLKELRKRGEKVRDSMRFSRFLSLYISAEHSRNSLQRQQYEPEERFNGFSLGSK